MTYKRKQGSSFIKKSKKSFLFNKIEYKSGLEKTMAILLTKNKIDFEYEPPSFKLVEGFFFPFSSYERCSNGKGDMIDRGKKKVIDIKYTPDFVGKDFIIETKGYANETFPLRWKMFKKLLTDKKKDKEFNITLFKPQTVRECEEVIKIIKNNTNEE